MCPTNDAESQTPTPQPLSPHPLFPSTATESPNSRWSFIRKAYFILLMQLLLTIVVSAVVTYVHPIKHFLGHTSGGLALYIVLIISPIIVGIPLVYYYNKYPLNLFLLMLFSVAVSLPTGLTCAFINGKAILEGAILTAVVVICLIIYTFWAEKTGRDFTFLIPFLFGTLMVVILFSLIQILSPFGKLSTMILAGVAAIIICVYIVFGTYRLLTRMSSNQYILASVYLFPDIFNIIIFLISLFDWRKLLKRISILNSSN